MIAAALPALPIRSRGPRIGHALLIAATLHALVILGVGFEPESRRSEPQHRQGLKVVLVQPKEAPTAKPEDPEVAAQVTQQGAGDQERSRLPQAAPPPAIATPEPPPTAAVERPRQPAPPARPAAPTRQETPAKPRLQARRADQAVPSPPAPTPPDPPRSVPQPRITAADLLAAQSEEIVRLTQELERKTAAYAKRPRRKAVSASTTEYKYAAYLEAWRRKVENIGNLNYPDEARRNRLYGNLVLHVAVRSDGSLERVRLLHSSGHRVLDDAAIRIVKLAAPFAPFPRDIAADTDVLDITRTWQFLSSNRFGWKD